jgi:hypothetical protein
VALAALGCSYVLFARESLDGIADAGGSLERERFAEKPPYVYFGNIIQALAAQFGVSDLLFALSLSQLGLTNP